MRNLKDRKLFTILGKKQEIRSKYLLEVGSKIFFRSASKVTNQQIVINMCLLPIKPTRMDRSNPLKDICKIAGQYLNRLIKITIEK